MASGFEPDCIHELIETVNDSSMQPIRLGTFLLLQFQTVCKRPAVRTSGTYRFDAEFSGLRNGDTPQPAVRPQVLCIAQIENIY